MEIVNTTLIDVKLLRPKKFSDSRGWFTEVFNANVYKDVGLPTAFVQDNQSFSHRGVLRGLHYQVGEPQGKLVRVLAGRIWDVAVDLRRRSPDFGKWAGFDLSEDQTELLWIPEGFGHGFLVLSETATVLYRTTGFYRPAGERCIRWDDPTLAIEWPLTAISRLSISSKDEMGSLFRDAELPEL